MFRGRSAWFSQSVSPALRDLWGEGPGARRGGLRTGPERGGGGAEDGPGRGSVRGGPAAARALSAPLPLSLPQRRKEAPSPRPGAPSSSSAATPRTPTRREIRQKLGHFIWEQMSDSLMEQLDELTPDEIKTSIKEDEQRIKGKRDLDDSDKENRVLKTPVGGKLAYCPLQDYPVNNMVTVDRYEMFLNLMGSFFSSEAKVELKKLENEEAERKRQHEREERQREREAEERQREREAEERQRVREEEERKREHEDRERERQHKERMYQRELEDKAKEREDRCQMQEREYEEQEKQRQHEKIIAELHNRNLELRILRLTGFSSNKNSLQPFLFRTAFSSTPHPGLPDDVEDSSGNKEDDDSDDLDSLY